MKQNTKTTNSSEIVLVRDQLHEDFKNSVLIVSATLNLVVFVTWLALELVK